jgi:diguanylate cyclase (GGDEF)-like protein
VATLMRDSVRPTDLVARLGGDEFALVLSDCQEEDAVRVVERVIARVAESEPAGAAPGSGRITLSAGMLWVPPRATRYALDTLLSGADRLMYEAKRAGGNQACRHSIKPGPA